MTHHQQQAAAPSDWEAQGPFQAPPSSGQTPPPQQPEYHFNPQQSAYSQPQSMPLQQPLYAPPQGMRSYSNMAPQAPRAGSALPSAPGLYNSQAQAPIPSQGHVAGSAIAMQQPRPSSAMPMMRPAYDPYHQPQYQQQQQQQQQQYAPRYAQQPVYAPPPPQHQFAPRYAQQPAYQPQSMMSMTPRPGSAMPMVYGQQQMWAQM